VEKPDDRKLIESAINGNIAEALGIHVARMRIEPGQPVRWGRGICMLPILTTGRGFATTQTENVMQVQTRGEFGGLGIEVTMEDGLIKVVAPIDETGTKSTVATGEDPAHAPSILERP
jgi:carboxyl-terminal processing protease